MIRTERKVKLPKGFTYPLGAEKISAALGDIPQVDSTVLTFEWRDEFWVSNWRERIAALGVVTLIEASFWERWGEWNLRVYSVPREYNAAARNYRLDKGLKELAAALRTADVNSERFNHSITFRLRDAMGR